VRGQGRRNTVVVLRSPYTDPHTDPEYMAFLNMLRAHWTLREFVQHSGSAFSIAYWSKVQSGQTALTVAAKNAIRTGVNVLASARGDTPPFAELLPDDPLTVIAGAVDGNAAVFMEGEAPATVVVLRGASGTTPRGAVTAVTDDGNVAGQPRSSRSRRKASASIDVSQTTRRKLNAVREKKGLTWEELLVLCLDMLKE